MPAPAKCPGCGTKLQPDWESCPSCPLSFLDAPPERGALQNDNFRAYGLPAILFGGLAFVMYQFSQFMWRTAEQNTEMYDTNAKAASAKREATTSREKIGGGVVPVDSKAIQGLVNEQVTGVYDPEGDARNLPSDGPGEQGRGAPARQARGEAAPEETGPGIVSITAAPTKRKAVREWKLRGGIYDLITLKPVPGVRMVFTDNATNSRAHIVTDQQGRYKVVLPPLTDPDRGYLVSITKAGYETTYLNPGTEGVAEMPLERRQEMVRELSTLIGEPATVHPDSETPLVTDFHLAPKQ
ncbi:MAG: hypothetical protein M0D55_10455 [Elusimicrobiota bacterium]|nr:MAG: hypothetical protein M0D55_10455 [Elusimicrobiota bacterium]